MKRHLVILTAAICVLSLQPAQAKPRPYEGVWASNAAACRDRDGVDRMGIAGDAFQWYETRCRARDVRRAGPRSWTMRMACEGEGQRLTVHPRITLVRPNRLVMTHGPVGPGKGPQAYIRCEAR
jgi:hypothetical protein